MAKVAWEMPLREYIRTAAAAAGENRHTVCVHTLWDAMKIADERGQAEVYKCFSDMFAGIGNMRAARAALFKACRASDKGGFYSVDYDRFLPYDEVWEENELPPIDSNAVLAYNDVYNYFLLGEYDKGLNILCELPPDARCMDEVFAVLYDAIAEGKRVDLKKYAYKIMVVAGIFTTKSADMVRVLLQGSEMTRTVLVDGVEFFLGEIEDARVLSAIGREFANENEYACAEMCFDKVLEENEIDEEALYYKAAIGFLREDSKAQRYWDRFVAVYAPFGAPVEVYERAFREKRVIEYGRVNALSVVEDIVRALGKREEDDPRYESALRATIGYANEENFRLLFGKKGSDEDVVRAALDVLVCPYVGNARKTRILNELMEREYEGRVAVAFDRKGVIFDCVKLPIRRRRAVWTQVYRQVSVAILCSEKFIPYRASALAAHIRDFEKACEKNDIDVSQEDVPFLSTVMAAEYNRAVRSRTNVDWVGETLPPLSPEELRRGIKKFPPEVIHL